MKTALVLGCSGLIGSHMVDRLKSEGYWVRGVDIKEPDYHKDNSDQFLLYDLRNPRNVEAVMRLDYTVFPPAPPLEFSYTPIHLTEQFPFDEVYQLAADMGGAGYIFTGEHDADIVTNSALINLNVAAWAKIYGVGKLFYSSSACVYPKEIQGIENHPGLKESDAYPANPDSDYGIEKLFSERLYLAYHRNYGMNVRISRFHNIYGPRTPFMDPKAKAPAAICRKVAICPLQYPDGPVFDTPYIEIWGDGEQARSFLYIDDCIDAVRLLMQSDFTGPVNIGSEEMISINDLAKMVIDISGKDIHIKNIDGPVGVRGRNSDNNLIREKLLWEPRYSLREGMENLYKWVESQCE